MTHTPLKLFDDHHPPSTDLIDDCVHCGFCLTTCPTYRLWGQEADSPRGRIYLMKLGLAGEVGLNQSTVSHFDRCLGCMACLTSCPSGVQYDKLIEATRANRTPIRSFRGGEIAPTDDFCDLPVPQSNADIGIPVMDLSTQWNAKIAETNKAFIVPSRSAARDGKYIADREFGRLVPSPGTPGKG